MTGRPIINNLLIATLVVLIAGLALTWVVAPGLLGNRFYAVGGSIAACAVAMLLVALLTAAQKKYQRAILLDYVQQLCDGNDASGLSEFTAVLGDRHPWFNVLSHIDSCIATYRKEIDELRHSRAAGDVRLRRLTDDRDQLLEIVTSLSEPVVAIDHYDELVMVNRSAQDLLGIDWDGPSTERQAVDRLVQCEELVRLLQDTRRRKLPTQRTSELNLDSEGAARSFRVTCTGISTQSDEGEDGTNDHGAVAVLNDISNEKAIQKRNADFVSSVSHEMKTPLAGIKAYVELLADGEADDEETQEEFLRVIDSQADRLQRLIENLLNLARIEAGVVQVKKSARSLNELLEEAFNVVSPAAEQKRIALSSELSPMYLGVLADRDMLMQTAINLLSNAIKYTPEGGAVTLRSRMADDGIKFEVQDTGVGLNEDDRHRVFEKFYRVKENREMASGTGLGLPLAKHIVEDVHNGRLTVESAVGNGSTFQVSLPGVRQMNGKD